MLTSVEQIATAFSPVELNWGWL